MLQINPISFKGTTDIKKSPHERREDLRDTAVAGGAAGAGYTAARNGGFKMFRQTSSRFKNVSGQVKNGIDTINEAKTVLTKPIGEAKGLFSRFASSARTYGNRMWTYLTSMKAGKFINKIMRTPVVRHSCNIFGGFLAGCVLLSGLGTLYNNSTQLVDKYTNKIAGNVNNILDEYNKNYEENE